MSEWLRWRNPDANGPMWYTSPGSMPEEIARAFDYLVLKYGKGALNSVKAQHEQALAEMMGQST